MKFLINRRKTNHVGSAYVSNTQTSDTDAEERELSQKMKQDKIGRIFAPLTKDEEMTLAKLISSKNEKRKI